MKRKTKRKTTNSSEFMFISIDNILTYTYLVNERRSVIPTSKLVKENRSNCGTLPPVIIQGVKYLVSCLRGYPGRWTVPNLNPRIPNGGVGLYLR